MKKLILLFAVLTTMFCADTSYAELTKNDIKEIGALIKESEARIIKYVDLRINETNTKIDFVGKNLKTEINAVEKNLKTEINAVRAEISAVEKNLKTEINAVRAEISAVDSKVGLLSSIFIAIIGAFAAIVACTIGFAIWDRKTMIRPFEIKVRKIEDEISENRTKLHSLLDALRKLSETDSRVAEVLKSFHLL